MKVVKPFRYVILFALSLLLPLQGHAHKEESEEAVKIRSQFPNIEINRIEPTPIHGLFELTVKDAVVYFHLESGTTLFGEMWSKEKVNLTAKRKAALQSEKINDLPLDKAIKIGSGPNTIIEVVDPDCSFCRKTHAFFSRREDLTRYVFLFPITQIHPEAEIKSLHILCSENKQKAYEDMLSGKLDDIPLEACNDGGVTDLLDEHKQIGKQLNVQGTPALWINGQFVSGADFEKIAKILGEHS